jgi:serine/threonine-protein kinase RsbT
MALLKHETLPVQTSADIVVVRQVARTWASEIGLGLVDLTKLVTAASELARNTLDHGHGGMVRFEMLNDGPRRGLRLIFEDQGPGIANIELAMKDGYTTGSGLGLGLSGSRRLVNEFEISSKVGEGTRVAITRWK